VATNLLGPAAKRQGPRLLWPCPFHDDHDPSFQVDLNRKTWRCWVCAIGGDAAELVKKVNKCDFPTAVKFLADLAGVASPSRGATGPPACRGGPPTPARVPAPIVSKPASPPPDEPSGLSWDEGRRPSLTRPPPASGGPGGGSALDYLRGRGLTEATVRAAGLGFTPAVMIPTRAGDRCFRFSGIVIPWRVKVVTIIGLLPITITHVPHIFRK